VCWRQWAADKRPDAFTCHPPGCRAAEPGFSGIYQPMLARQCRVGSVPLETPPRIVPRSDANPNSNSWAFGAPAKPAPVAFATVLGPDLSGSDSQHLLPPLAAAGIPILRQPSILRFEIGRGG